MKGQMTRTDKGQTPSRTDLGKVASVAKGHVDASNGKNPHSMPKADIDKHCK